jgi:hypothetical protein
VRSKRFESNHNHNHTPLHHNAIRRIHRVVEPTGYPLRNQHRVCVSAAGASRACSSDACRSAAAHHHPLRRETFWKHGLDSMVSYFSSGNFWSVCAEEFGSLHRLGWRQADGSPRRLSHSVFLPAITPSNPLVHQRCSLVLPVRVMCGHIDS